MAAVEFLQALGKRKAGPAPKKVEEDDATKKKKEVNPFIANQVFTTIVIVRTLMVSSLNTAEIARLAPLNRAWHAVSNSLLSPLRASKFRLSFRVTDPNAVRMWRDESYPLGILLQAVERWKNEDGVLVTKFRVAKGQPLPLRRSSLRASVRTPPAITANGQTNNNNNAAATANGFVGPPWTEAVFTGPTATLVRPLLALFPSDVTVYGPHPGAAMGVPERPQSSRRVSFQVYGQEYFIRIKYGYNDTWEIVAVYMTETLLNPLAFGAAYGHRDIEWIFPAARRQILRKAVLNVCPPGRGKPLIQLLDDGLDVLLSTAQSGYTYKGHLRYLFGARPELWISDLLSALLKDDGYPWSHSVALYHDCDATIRDLISKLENRLTTIRAWHALPEEKREDMMHKNKSRTAENWASGVLSNIVLELRGVKIRGKRGTKEWVDDIVMELKKWDTEKTKETKNKSSSWEDDGFYR
ncbi:hypothetical protein SmJEL517_g04412 [Synchytrium microbalum]|uniref:Uncharacterized protein n=1 Tax=Synchytrium microbalum TaxID=1806994 RepID=A0A507BUB2_9FUNG|nr:uncharacterized protein SmJEL517_g04412 [Synchytrium microbalum]TPX32537.1 hypothetical protein SmJEL517_g04412 [Synchytrium microbalum]